KAIVALKSTLENMRGDVDKYRIDFDAKKKTLEEKKNDFHKEQRTQFDAEKKVAIADTSVFNIQKSLQQIVNEKEQRLNQINTQQVELDNLKIKLAEKQEELSILITQQE